MKNKFQVVQIDKSFQLTGNPTGSYAPFEAKPTWTNCPLTGVMLYSPSSNDLSLEDCILKLSLSVNNRKVFIGNMAFPAGRLDADEEQSFFYDFQYDILPGSKISGYVELVNPALKSMDDVVLILRYDIDKKCKPSRKLNTVQVTCCDCPHIRNKQ